jgi:hypothetical protein
MGLANAADNYAAKAEICGFGCDDQVTRFDAGAGAVMFATFETRLLMTCRGAPAVYLLDSEALSE